MMVNEEKEYTFVITKKGQPPQQQTIMIEPL